MPYLVLQPFGAATPVAHQVAHQVAHPVAHHAGPKPMHRAGPHTVLLGLLLTLVALALAAFTAQLVSPRALTFAGFTVDRLSAILMLLVASVGSVSFRFSQRYLDGDPRQARFLRWLAFTVTSAFILMLATNLVAFFLAWSLTSAGLHALLTHYPERAEAIRAARKKFLISRLGDVALIAAIVVIRLHWHTFDLTNLLAQLSASPTIDGWGTATALLIVAAALTKSAQFPFHSWLPETMESPTPVSALMHAGIINAGGALLLRTSPLLLRVPSALLTLAAIGTITLAIGSIAMWAQVKVKRTLAWSTVSQMGFLMVQCGIAAFPAALLHLVAHGYYKAWSFLDAGQLNNASIAVRPQPPRALALAALGTLATVPAAMAASMLTGFMPLSTPGELALTAILAISLGQLWIGLLGTRANAVRVAAAVLLTAVTVVVAFSLYIGAAAYLSPVIRVDLLPTGPAAWVAAALPVATLTALVILHAMLPTLSRTAAGRALRVHGLNGFYLGALADRVVAACWPPIGRTHGWYPGQSDPDTALRSARTAAALSTTTTPSHGPLT